MALCEDGERALLPLHAHAGGAMQPSSTLRERQGVPLLADMAHSGAGAWVTTAKRRPPGGELTTTERTTNRALAGA